MINRDSINFSVAINIPLCIIADIIKKSSYYFRYDYLLTIHIWSILDIRVNRNRKYVFPREYHNSRKHGGFIFKSKLTYKTAVLTHICLRFNGIDKYRLIYKKQTCYQKKAILLKIDKHVHLRNQSFLR